MASALTIHIDGEAYELDDLKLREVVELETAFGKPVGEIELDSAKATAYLVWFAKRRRDPKFTLDQALDLPMTALDEPAAKKPGKASRPRKPSGAPSSDGSTA